MAPSDHGFSSSSASGKPPAFPKFSPSGEADENDPSHGEMAPKKPPMKHFMSSTISAASKAAVPRKKILADRNEASDFSGSQLHYSPHLDSRTLPSDSSSKPYDPLTNYLSPRPKFLRYNPNRRREIFPRQEDEEKDGFGVKATVSFDPHGAVHQDILPDEADSSWFLASEDEDSMKQEDETRGEEYVSDEEIEELEEEEEEKHSIFKGFMKLLLVIGILFTSTLHISFMNSPPSPGLKAVRGQNHTSHVIFRCRSSSYIRREWIQEVTVEDVCDHHRLGEAKEVVEQFLGTETGKFEDEDGDHPRMEESGEIENVVDHSLDKTEADSGRVEGIEYEKHATTETGKFEDNDDAESGEIEYVDDHSLAETGLDSDQLKWVETSQSDRSSSEENEANGFSSFKDEAINDDDEVETMESDIEKTEFFKMSSDPSFDRFLVVLMIIAVASATGFLFCRKKYYKKQSVSTRNPPPKSSEAEKISSEEPVLPSVEELMEKVESFAKPPRPIRRQTEEEEEDAGDFNKTGAPAVELIGEFVVGKVSERVKRMKIEESQDSVSCEKGGRRSKEAAADPAVSSQAQLSVPELSALKSSSSSASYGSFIASKEIVKKKEDGEARTAVRTPVRRSSRISNRAVLSP